MADENWNSAYPYTVGPTFYGVWADRKVSSIGETVTVYNPSTANIYDKTFTNRISVFPNPASDLIAIQLSGVNERDVKLSLKDSRGRTVAVHIMYAGQTIAYFDVATLYKGVYFVHFESSDKAKAIKVIVE